MNKQDNDELLNQGLSTKLPVIYKQEDREVKK